MQISVKEENNLFFKKWKNIEKYDIKNLIPILIQSICRGETVFGL